MSERYVCFSTFVGATEITIFTLSTDQARSLAELLKIPRIDHDELGGVSRLIQVLEGSELAAVFYYDDEISNFLQVREREFWFEKIMSSGQIKSLIRL